jgi:6-hydroxynicotinate reductase
MSSYGNPVMTEHTKVDFGADSVDGETASTPGPTVLERAAPRSERMASNKIECNACPVLCQISEGRTGACDRYANADGRLIRVDPVVFLSRAAAAPEAGALLEDATVEFGAASEAQAPAASEQALFVTGVGASSTYPDYKPAPFIVASKLDDVDMITVVTEGIFSYCSFKVKIDTDRFLGPEQSNVRCNGEIVGHVSTAEYGSQMLSLGGVHHLTGGSKKEGRVTCDMMLALGNKEAVDLTIDGGASLVIRAGAAPIVDGVEEQRMRVGCGSATIGIFAKQWFGHVDEVVVVDDHITGVLTEHQAGRYFQVANPGTGWGGTDIQDPLAIVEGFDPAVARPGMRILMVSTTGEHAQWYELDPDLVPRIATMPDAVRHTVERIGENCEPSLATVLFLGGAGGSLRAGATENPVLLTRAIKQKRVNVTCGGAPAYVWPGGGITVMVDVSRMPDRSFGTVPTPAIVAPIEFTMTYDAYRDLGGHLAAVRSLESVLAHGPEHTEGAPLARRTLARHPDNPWPATMPPVLG